ncbi:MAG TPA: hypothetical protein VEA15_04710 [Caulobacteraceae bacterium]|nr:hypothetical protein [Caulobacteraceae bacterium]
MSLTLPRAPRAYDAGDQQTLRGLVEAADRRTLKHGRDLDPGPRAALILTSPDGARWRVTVGDDGVLATAAV